MFDKSVLGVTLHVHVSFSSNLHQCSQLLLEIMCLKFHVQMLQSLDAFHAIIYSHNSL
jgi:hypothetical protein